MKLDHKGSISTYLLLCAVNALIVVMLPSAASAEQYLDAIRDTCPAVNAVPTRISEVAPLEPGTTYIEADQGTARDDRIYEFSGAVQIRREQQHIVAGRAQYDAGRNVVKVFDGVRLMQDGLQVTGTTAQWDLGAQQGVVEDVQYRMDDSHAHGHAARAILEGRSVIRLTDATYTTCPPGHVVWRIKAGSLRLDRTNNVGSARHARIELMNLPVWYFPYLTFPLVGRKSGLLAPMFDQSAQWGTVVGIPFYWNIAPHRDATIIGQNFSARGPRVIGQFRYLNPASHGQMDAEYFPQDKKANGQERYFYAWRHRATPATNWRVDIEFNQVSDVNYFIDFGDRLSTTSILNLRRSAKVSYRARSWSFRGNILDYQPLGETREYRKLPELVLQGNLPQKPFGLYFAGTGNYTLFRLADRLVEPDQKKVVGSRIDLRTSVSLPLAGAPGFIRPKLTLYHTRYILAESGSEIDAEAQRTLPVASIDSGVFLERDFVMRNNNYLQTLEPRLFYLYAPRREQSALPVFDSGLPELSFTRLFAENRFSGADRVGDANQLTVAVISRVLAHQSGVQLLSASVGSIFYFRDREVTLGPNDPAQAEQIATAPSSDLFAELRARPRTDIKINAHLQWAADTNLIQRGNIQLHYRVSSNRLVNLGYRYDRQQQNKLQEIDISLLWSLGTNWRIIGRRSYSIVDRTDRESLFGFEYNSCCWALRAVYRRYQTVGDAMRETYMLQVELKGLASIGNDIKGFLEDGEYGITGYR